ncbi:MAG: chloride channel protein [Halofilum sp. (in: g-proteobacteria)]|nr:chloride channel protein [Halofilum sp. (in: g-proteobacteria)]
MSTVGDSGAVTAGRLWSVVRGAAAVIALGLGVGTLAALAADAFVYGILWLNDWLWISPRSRMMAGDWAWLAAATVAVPAAGGLLVGLLTRYLVPDREPQGPADVIEAAQRGHGRVPPKGGLATAAAALVSLGSGASVGQYGPLVHLGATIGSLFGRFSRGAPETLSCIGIGCGVAAAIATAFNAPIAGILFAHEVVLRHYSLRAFAPITVASTMGYVIATVVLEREPLFRVEDAITVAAWEYLPFIGIGVGGALVAIAFMRSVIAAESAAARVPVPEVVKPAMAGAVLGMVALWLPDVLGIGKEVLRFSIIPGAFGSAELALLLVAKLAMTALCLGFGFVGGVFSPALVIGALFGALVASLLGPVLPEVGNLVAVFAICGMAAVTSSVIGAPISTILIVFELTRNYDLTTAVMISVVFANLVSYRLYGRSMFDKVLQARDVDLSLGRDQLVLDRMPIAPYVSEDYVVARRGERCEELRDRLLEADAGEAQLVAPNGDYLGTITLGRLLRKMERDGQRTVDRIAVYDRAALRENASIRKALTRAERNIGALVPVLAREGRRLVGVVDQSTLVRAYRETLHSIRSEEHAA